MSNTREKYQSVLKKYRKRSRFADLFRRIIQNKGALAGLIILCLIFIMFIGSFFISYQSMTAVNARNRFAPPSLEYPFGTDNLGRNMFLRLVYGTRYSIFIGFGAVLLGLTLGLLLGCLAGFYGGMYEHIIMRACDVLASVPGILSAMVIMMAFGQSVGNLIFAMGFMSTTGYARISRASVLRVRGEEYVEAARAIGISNFRIIFTQVLPNGMAPLIITVTTSLGGTILGASGLSFIGFGVPPPAPEWGGLLASGRSYLTSAPWITVFPGIAIMLIVLGFSMLGDGLRDALDPKLKGRR